MDDHPPTFEDTYPKHEFSVLVRLGVLLGGWIGRRRRVRGRERTPEAAPDEVPSAPA